MTPNPLPFYAMQAAIYTQFHLGKKIILPGLLACKEGLYLQNYQSFSKNHHKIIHNYTRYL